MSSRARRGTPALAAVVAVAVGVMATPGGAGRGSACPRWPAPGDHSVGLSSGARGEGGLEADAVRGAVLVHVPAGIRAGKRLPLVLALHGVGGSGTQMERYSGLSAVADEHSFVVVYPTAPGPFWNSTGAGDRDDDVAFIAGVIATVKRRLCVDRRRVFVVGVSNGGEMAALAACRLSGELAGVATVAAGYDGRTPCRPRRPVALLDIHGTEDPIVPYDAEARSGAGRRRFVAGWVKRDACWSGPRLSRPAPRTTAYDWDRCAGRARVEQIAIVGGRHQWPGAEPPDPGPPATFCAACRIWSFLGTM